MFKVFKKIFGDKHERDVKKYSERIDEINQYFESYQSLTHDELREKTNEFRSRIKDYLSEYDAEIAQLSSSTDQTEDLEEREEIFRRIDELKTERDEHQEEILQEILPEAFAVVKETSRRFSANETLSVRATDADRDLATKKDFVDISGDQAIYKNHWKAGGNEIEWNMVHYDVQLIGGMVLHEGKIAEMATGEGKTLVATLPAYLNGLTGDGVHIITVNDYLAKRDADWVGPIFQFLQLSVDCIDHYQPHSEERRGAYASDITYGTNNGFGFDYLRDNMVRSVEEKVQRKLHYVMVDEVDSVLIDDARTPLIISGPVPKDAEQQEYEEINPRVNRLYEEQKKLASRYLADAKKLIDSGSTGYNEDEGGMALLRSYRAMPKSRPLIKYLSEDGTKVILQKAENHYMQEQSKHMHIVDEPLYFTIEEKTRSVELTDKGAEFMAKGSDDPNMFVMPDIGVELTKIDKQEDLTEQEKSKKKDEVLQDFSVKSQRLHATQQLLKAYSLFERDEDYVVMDGEVKIVDEQTGRMMEGRRYSDGLHQALEAKEQVKVGALTQTYATITLQNYFRMYHKLSGMTGTAETEAGEFWEIYELDVVVIPTNRPIIRDDRDDLIYKTQIEKYKAVIEEIQDLTSQGRPVLVGTTSVDISEKLSRMLNRIGLQHNVLNAKQHQREADIVAEAGKPGKVTIATNMAGRGTDIKISDDVKKSGGLAIIGTERHDSRRVDRQLRGRAGRQGDPGSSQFYVSLEDNLMRLFMPERASKMMNNLGHKDGEAMQASMLTNAIERAQKKVEENNFGIRKRLLEYDDVMNIQRDAIYKKREHAMSGERLAVDLYNMFEGYSSSVVELHKSQGNYETFKNELRTEIGYETEITEDQFTSTSVSQLSEDLKDEIFRKYNEKMDGIVEVVLPFMERVNEKEAGRYKRVSLPFADGSSRVLNVTADMELAIDSHGKTIQDDIEKTVTLALLDENWKEHLRSMDELKESTQAASFEQKDPLVVYKMEAYELFENLIFKINQEVTSWLIKGRLAVQDEADVKQARKTKSSLPKTTTNESATQAARRRAMANAEGPTKVETFVRTEEKIGRNDPCPCGSGKKYKQCHGKK